VRQHLGIIGGGVMGTGIATLAIGWGRPVTLVEVDDLALDRARRNITAQLRHAQLLGVLPECPRGELVTTTDLSALTGAAAVVEAVTEHAPLKAKLLAGAAATVAPGTPLITNTSGIPIDELAAAVDRPGDLIGTHFMNPTYLITMVEVIRGPQTADVTLDAVTALLSTLDRRSIVVHAAPGFVTSRLLHPMINRAVAIVAAGTAQVSDVDALMEGCLGHPTGPLRTADLIGLDNLVDSLNVLLDRTGDESCRPAPLLLEKVLAGHLGRKSGQGFYHYG
jgi:methoxymalonate biosynthesis protein